MVGSNGEGVRRQHGLPQVSVVLPAHNASQTLTTALESVRRQTLEDWECVVVDDGSTDDTAVVVREVASRDQRFRLISLSHGGVARAANVGVAACRAGYVARMDGDDLMRRDRLQVQVDALEQNDWDAVGSHVRLFPERELGAGMRAYERWLNSIESAEAIRREAFVECPVANPSLMFRRELIERYRYRELDWPEDYDLVLRLLADDRRLGIVPRRLLGWRHGPGRLTTSHPHYRVERFTAAKAHFLAAGFLAGGSHYILWGYGGTGKLLRGALARVGRHPERIVELHPRKLGQTIHGALVIPPQQLPPPGSMPLLVSVAGHEARDLIRAFLEPAGYVEGRHFVCTA